MANSLLLYGLVLLIFWIFALIAAKTLGPLIYIGMIIASVWVNLRMIFMGK